MFNQRLSLKSLQQLAVNTKTKLAHTSSESRPQYDVSEKMKKLFDLKSKQREATKAYFQKLVMNPYRPKFDTVPFDPVLFRYNALNTYNIEYFKPTLKNFAFFFALYILPIGGTTWMLITTRGSYEKQLRGGEIAYEDRHAKGYL